MTLLTEVVGTFRTHWASRFVDEVDVDRYDSAGETFNRTTGVHEGGTPTAIITGGGTPNALIRPGTNEADEEQLPNELRTFSGYSVFLAFDAPALAVEDRILVVASVSEPELVSQVLVVTAVIADSYNTKRRVVAELDLGRGSGRG